MELPAELKNNIVEFLTSLPNIHDSSSQRAFILSAGLDSQLQHQINFSGPPAQSFQLLVSTLISYGKLKDGRDALEAVLEAAKNYVGQDKKDYCDILIQKLRSFRSPSSQQIISPERPSIAVTKREAKTSPVSHFDDMAQKQVGEKTTSFSWLHLTDFHCGMKNQHWLWPNVREIFFDDLERLHEKCGPWDLVLFTGDLTQKGSAKEFQKVDEIFEQLWEHLRKLGSFPKILAVPGNHDLVRPRKITPPVKLLQQWLEKPDVEEEFWKEESSPYRKVIAKAFKNYVEWWEKQSPRVKDVKMGILSGDFSATIEKDGAKLGIVGLNTSFLQLTDDKYEGRLTLHTMQFHGACNGDGPEWAKQHHACLLLTHHPPAWLSSNAQQHLNAEITDHGQFVVHLCGHMHKTVYRSIAESGTEARRLWQGRSLFGLEYYGKGSRMQRMHGYTVGKIELRGDTGTLTFWPREDRVQGGQRNLVPDYSVNLPANEHTSPREFELLQPYVIKETSLLPESSPEQTGGDASNFGNSRHTSPKNKNLDVRILAVLYGHYQNTPGEPKISFRKLLDKMGEKDFRAVHEELFKLKEKDWINSEFLEDGQAGLVWITSTGMKIAQQLTQNQEMLTITQLATYTKSPL